MKTPYGSFKVLENYNDECRIAYLTIILDRSGSMKQFQDAVYSSVSKLLSTLRAKESVDFEYRIQLITFADGVTSLTNGEYLPADQLEELFTEDAYSPAGGTNLTAIVNHIDGLYSRSSKVIKSLAKGNPATTTLIVTDFVGTDDESRRKAAMTKLRDNRYFKKYCKCLCIFTGPENRKNDVLALCGDADNLISLETTDIASLLTPILINSTVNFTDGTHLNSDSSTNTVAKEVIEREKKGEEGADDLTKALEELLKQVS